jgi:hypothetical protein
MAGCTGAAGQWNYASESRGVKSLALDALHTRNDAAAATRRGHRSRLEQHTIRSRQTSLAAAALFLFWRVIVEAFFQPVREVERPEMASIFIRSGPTEQAFMGRTVFLRTECFRPEILSSGPETA